MLTQEQIGRRVRAAREELRLSQTSLGERIGRTHAAISDVERGKTNVGLADLARLAEILGKPLSYFTGELDVPATGGATAVYRRGEANLLAEEEGQLARTLEDFKAYARRVAREQHDRGR